MRAKLRSCARFQERDHLSAQRSTAASLLYSSSKAMKSSRGLPESFYIFLESVHLTCSWPDWFSRSVISTHSVTEPHGCGTGEHTAVSIVSSYAELPRCGLWKFRAQQSLRLHWSLERGEVWKRAIFSTELLVKQSRVGELASGKLHILKLPFGRDPHNKHAPSALSNFFKIARYCYVE